MVENPDFERDIYSRTAIGVYKVYKVGQDSIRLMKWLAYYDRSCHENINLYGSMGSVVNGWCKYTYKCDYNSGIKTHIFGSNTHITKNSTQV